MPEVYDNWERLVAATLKREKFYELALASSRETSFSSSASARFNSPFNFKFKSKLSYETGGSSLLKVIQLADRVASVSEDTDSFKQECSEIKSKAQRVSLLLRQGVRASHDLYDRPARHVMDATKSVLKKAISLMLKCRGFKRVFAAVNTASFQDISSQLEHSIGNICWLLRDDQYRGVPPIAADEPVLCNIWELIAILHTGLVEDHCNAVASLVSLAYESNAYGTMILEEGGIEPLLRLVQEGTPEVQENAVRVIALIGKENWAVIANRVSALFVTILKGPRTKLQGTVAWAMSELAEFFYYDDYIFVYMLSSLALKTLTEDGNIWLARKARGVDSTMRRNNLKFESRASNTTPETDDYIKAMVTKALWHLSNQSWMDCRVFAESRALCVFAFLLDKGPNEAKYHSAMALMRITAMAENDTELRKTVFKSNLPVYKAVVDQLFRVIDEAELEILIPCIKAIGNLSRTFKATETRMIGPLVRLLDNMEPEVSKEACVALTKFAHSYNYLHMDHSKAIIASGGVKHLVQLVYFGEQLVKSCALILLCYITLHVPDSVELARAGVLTVLEWAMKQASLIQIEDVAEKVLPEAKWKLELYQSRVSRGFH